MKIGNSFFNHEEDEQVTYFDLASTPHTQISVSNFAQIDFFLVEDVWMYLLLDIWSDKNIALQSHHFILTVIMNLNVPSEPKKKHTHHFDINALADSQIAFSFIDRFNEHFMEDHLMILSFK